MRKSKGRRQFPQAITAAQDENWLKHDLPRLRKFFAEYPDCLAYYNPLLAAERKRKEVQAAALADSGDATACVPGIEAGLTLDHFAKKYGGKTRVAYHEACHAAAHWWLGACIDGMIASHECGAVEICWVRHAVGRVYDDTSPLHFSTSKWIKNAGEGGKQCAESVLETGWGVRVVTLLPDGRRLYCARLLKTIMGYLSGEVGEQMMLGVVYDRGCEMSLGGLWQDYQDVEATLKKFRVAWKSEEAEALLCRSRELLRDLFQQPVIQQVTHTLAQELIATTQYGEHAGQWGYYLTGAQIAKTIDRVAADFPCNAVNAATLLAAARR